MLETKIVSKCEEKDENIGVSDTNTCYLEVKF